LARLIEKEVLNRMAVLILRGSIKDGETARVVLEDGRLDVLPNHGESSEMESEEEDMDLDEGDALDAIAGDDMDLYD
jgi:hypothetical protein